MLGLTEKGREIKCLDGLRACDMTIQSCTAIKQDFIQRAPNIRSCGVSHFYRLFSGYIDKILDFVTLTLR